MIKHWRFSLAICGLIFGLSIVGISLTSASQVSSHGRMQASQKTFYLGREILPDHILYPLVAAADRVRLETAAPEEKIYLKVGYANRRLAYAQDLLAKDNATLALSTVTKSQKYMNQAAHEVIDSQMPASVTDYLIQAMTAHILAVKELGQQFNDSDRAVVDELCQQNLILLERLAN